MSVNQKEHHTFNYGRQTIRYRLLILPRKTMEIAVHPDLSVVVKAPVESDHLLIEQKLLKRARWILRQLRYFKQFEPRTPDRRYVNGETHLYMGRQFRLKLNTGHVNNVKLTRGFFHVSSREASSPDMVKKQMDNWYRQKAQIYFAGSLDRCWPKFARPGIDKPLIRIKRMRKRWGSYSKEGHITLNLDLIKAPGECIDYVITHELCHLQYPDHSNDFYNLLESLLPDWRKIKHRLEITLK